MDEPFTMRREHLLFRLIDPRFLIYRLLVNQMRYNERQLCALLNLLTISKPFNTALPIRTSEAGTDHFVHTRLQVRLCVCRWTIDKTDCLLKAKQVEDAIYLLLPNSTQVEGVRRKSPD